jgi:hypothetical protein
MNSDDETMEINTVIQDIQTILHPTLMFGDNLSMVLNTSVSSSVLKKKHNVVVYHHVQQAIAANVMKFAYIKSDEIVCDILTKP